MELRSDSDIFSGAVSRYADIFGANGMKVYRELAETEWAKDDGSDSGRNFRITQIMESLARASGDVEELIGIIRRDLSHSYSYLRIAEAYREASRHDQALQWAESGLKAFPEKTDNRLREFAADEYHRLHRHDDAMNLMWRQFAERPFLEAYKTLERHANTADRWEEWRERALAEIRRRIAKAKESSSGRTVPGWMRRESDHSLLVEVCLYEGNQEEAWREAQAGGCSDNLWLALAATREKDYPEDAAGIYLKQAEDAIVNARNSRYDDSVSLLVKAAAVMKRMDRGAEFARHLQALKVRYKIKRNFIKLLEQKRTSLM